MRVRGKEGGEKRRSEGEREGEGLVEGVGREIRGSDINHYPVHRIKTQTI